MPKTYRVNFHRGSRFRGKGADGEVRLLQNARVESESLISMRYPRYLSTTVSPDTIQLFSYRGRMIQSSKRRNYTADYTGGAERICYSQYGDWPKKQINSNELPLGIVRPVAPPVIDQASSPVIAAPTIISLAAGSGALMKTARVSARVAVKTNIGVLPPSGRTIVTPANDNSAIQITWSSPARGDITVTGFLVFVGDPDDENLVAELSPGASTYTHTGYAGGYPDKAKSYDQTLPYQYFYTFSQDCEGVRAESGPSPVTPPSARFSGRRLNIPVDTDGYWDQAEVQSVSATASAIGYGTGGTTLNATVTKPVLDADKGMYYTTVADHKLKKGDWCMLKGLLNTAASSVTGKVVSFASPHPYVVGDWAYIVSGNATLNGKTVRVSATTSLTVTLDMPSIAGWAGTVLGFSAMVEVIDVVGDNVYLDYGSYMNGTWGTTKLVRNGSGLVLYWEWNAYHNGLVVHTTDQRSGTSIEGDVMPFGPSEKFLIDMVDPYYNGTKEMECVRLSDDPGAFLVLDQPAPSITNTMPVPTLPLATTWPILRCEFNVDFAALPTPCPSDGDLVQLVIGGTRTITSICRKTGNTLLFRKPSGADVGNLSVTMKWVPKNNYFVGRRIYRVGDTSEFLLVQEIPLDQDYLVDYRGPDYLGDACSSYQVVNNAPLLDAPAPETLEFLVSHYDMHFAIDGDYVLWTDKGRPDAWIPEFREKFPSKPVGLASTRQTLAVLCTDGIYRLEGNSPTDISRSTTNAVDGCMARGSIQTTEHGVIYLGKRGLNIFDGHDSRCITDERFDVKQLFGTSPDTTLWALPWLGTTDTKAFAEAIRVDGALSYRPDWSNTLPGFYNGFQSFMYRGCYFIYNTHPAYAGMGTWVVDLTREGFPMHHLGISPSDVFVDDNQTIYMLFAGSTRPITTVTITSP